MEDARTTRRALEQGVQLLAAREPQDLRLAEGSADRFPGGAGEDQLEPISWDEWFETFEENDLAFLYQEQKADGEDSTFFKLVKRDS